MLRNQFFNCEKCAYIGTSKLGLEKHVTSNHVDGVCTDYGCRECNYVAKNRMDLENHIKFKHLTSKTWNKNEEEVNCEDCDFQGTSKPQLKKHINLKHTETGFNNIEAITCRICGEKFRDRRNFMNHRKSEHLGSVALCRNFSSRNCIFSKEMCWWKHEETSHSSNQEKIGCYICNDSFKNKAEMMIHRKKQHTELVKECSKFSDEICRFRSDACWFRHGKDEASEEEEDSEGSADASDEQSDFQNAQRKKKPPL